MSSFTPAGVADDGGTAGGPAAEPSSATTSAAPPAPDTPRSVADILRSGGLPSVEQLKAELERQGLPDAVPLVIEAAVKRPPVVSNPARIIPPRTNRMLFAPLTSDAPGPPAAPAPSAPEAEPAGAPPPPADSPGSSDLAPPEADPVQVAGHASETAVEATPEASAEPMRDVATVVAVEAVASRAATADPSLERSDGSLPRDIVAAAAAAPGLAEPPTPEPTPVVASPAFAPPVVPRPEPDASLAPPAPQALTSSAPLAAPAPDQTSVLAPVPPLASEATATATPVLAPQQPRATRPTPVRSPIVQRQEVAALVRVAARRRRRGGGVRALLTLVVLGAIAAGAIVAVQRFVLAKAWPAEWKALASFIESETGFSFERSVPVRELSAADFAVRAGAVRLGLPDDGGLAGAADRAMGLWEGEYDPLSGARAAAAVWPAVYDPDADAVYVDATLGSSNQRDAYVARELTMALYDQRLGWSRTLQTLGPSQALAYRAGLEGEATVVATAWLARTLGGDPTSSRASEQLRAPEADPSVWAALPGALGLVARAPSILGSVAALERPAPVPGTAPVEPGGSDVELYGWLGREQRSAPVPSLGLGEQPAAASVVGPRGTMGPGYWFTVLASRLDPAVAWMVAGTWAGDQAITVQRGEQVCVRTSIVAADGGLDAWRQALSDWVARGPSESAAEVVAGDDHVGLVSCDPGPGADTRSDLDVVGALMVLAVDQWATTSAEADAGG